jgi:hypothetical protein
MHGALRRARTLQLVVERSSSLSASSFPAVNIHIPYTNPDPFAVRHDVENRAPTPRHNGSEEHHMAFCFVYGIVYVSKKNLTLLRKHDKQQKVPEKTPA